MAAPTPTPNIDPSAVIADPARLQALRQTGLLDTIPEQNFDRLTRLAARLTGASATFISLVDAERDFYKSHCGFGEPLTSARQWQGRTFCHYTMLSDQPLVIEDVTVNATFAAVPTVQTLGVRAYVGIPLVLDGGYVIGSFCAVDIVPRVWSADDLDVLIELAHATTREIQLRHMAQAALDNARQAREAARARQEILAAVSHDLRTPLQVIDMSMQVMDRLTDSERGVAIERAHRASRSMSRMVEDLLEYSQLQGGGLSLQYAQIEAASLLQDAAEMMTPVAIGRGIVLLARTAGDARQVQVDYQRMLRVFTNLVGNAIKFSPAGGVIDLSLKSDGTHCCFTIADQGQGIAAEDLPFLFDRFWQADGEDSRGTGLGLTIARSIVEAHGGEIGVDSVLNQGSRFHVRLPAMAPG